jgi:FAD-dependent oxidoreductase domain-containing protein 1
VLVIGGGAIGAATAYFLRLLDPAVEVTVVERDPTYKLASTPRASGGIRRLFSLPENIELSNFSMEFFDAFADTMAVDDVRPDIGLEKNGYLFIVPPSGREILERNFETQRRMGCNVAWLEPGQLKERWPSMNVDDLAAGVYSPDDGWLDPHGVLMGLRNKARSMGVLFQAADVIGLERASATVTTAELDSGERIKADHFVNAAGAWAKDICALVGEQVPIEPLKRYEHYFESQDPIEALPYIKDPDRLAFSARGPGLFRRRAHAGSAPRLRLRGRPGLLRERGVAGPGQPLPAVRSHRVPEHPAGSLRSERIRCEPDHRPGSRWA